MNTTNQKFVKIIMRDKTTYTLTFEKAQMVLESPQQIVMLKDDESGEWSGEALNKADIMRTDRDFDAEREYQKLNTPKIPELPLNNQRKIDVEKYRPDFMKHDQR